MIRDGAGFELLERIGSQNEQVIGEVFRSDARRELTISLFKNDMPVDVIEKMIAEAKADLLPFLDD